MAWDRLSGWIWSRSASAKASENSVGRIASGSVIRRPSSDVTPVALVVVIGRIRWPIPPMHMRTWGISASGGIFTSGLIRPQRPWLISIEQKAGTWVSGAIV